MNILLHICCGPCALYPIKTLKDGSHNVTGFFYNHNIHPYQEYKKRLESVVKMGEETGTEIICNDDYALEEFLKAVANNYDDRCSYCYSSRLNVTAAQAAAKGFEAFSSTLLYSRYQKHEEIIKTAEKAAENYGVKFYYEDFRKGWQEGIRISKEMGLYRQQYCGCIYSEKERYFQV
ncbi:MAG: epoxyqueuosine reductase QueH [Desulfuromonadales bacterium]|nr:epoxyqueuosine reductase QueH [Desulfuromonadales bacterium]